MEDIKNEFILYRERSCSIENKKIEVENLILNGLDADNKKIKELRKEIKKLELENKKIDNILKLLPDKYCKVISRIYLEGKDKKKVAKELERTERQINYNLEKALRLFSDKFKKLKVS